MNPKPLCIYHHDCADGFAAAWVVRKYFGDGNVDFHPGIYGKPPPDVTGRDVILVDFSYKRPTMLALIEQARSVLILDHHATAQDDLKDLPEPAVTVFDMNRSGAMIAWEHFFRDQQAPLLLTYIEDRDLWRFSYPSTRDVTSALFAYPFEFLVWDVLIENGVRGLINEGLAINRARRKDVAQLIEATRRMAQIGEHIVPVANVPWMFASDVGHELSKDYPFAATYYDDADGRRWSLRSQPEGADVAAIAESFGGGGHTHAAGFWMTEQQACSVYLTTAAVSGNGDLDDDHPLWLVNAQIDGLLLGYGANEDHEDVLTFLRNTGLPETTVTRIHRAIVCAETQLKAAQHELL